CLATARRQLAPCCAESVPSASLTAITLVAGQSSGSSARAKRRHPQSIISSDEGSTMFHFGESMRRSSSDGRRTSRRHSKPQIEGMEPRLALAAGITEFPLPVPGADPEEIAGAIDGSVWFTLSGTGQLGTINTDTLAISAYSLPQSTGPIEFHGITSGPD